MSPAANQLHPSPLRRLDSTTSSAICSCIETQSTSDKLRKDPEMNSAELLSSSVTSEPLVVGIIPAAPLHSILQVKTQLASLTKEAISLHEKFNLQLSHPRRKVRFSEIYVRCFPYCLGDNPSVHGGLPLALDYSVKPSVRMEAVNAYERERRSQRKPRIENLRLSKDARRQRLDELGYSSWELSICKLQVRTQQLQRDWSYKTRTLEPLQAILEVSAKAVANATWNRRRKQEEQKWITAHRGNYSRDSIEPVLTEMHAQEGLSKS
jgi:hypothetical protein